MRLVVAIFLGLLSLACAIPSTVKSNDENLVQPLRPPPPQRKESPATTGPSKAAGLNRKISMKDLEASVTILHVYFYCGKRLGTGGLLNEEADKEARNIVEGFLMNHNGLSEDLGKKVNKRKVAFMNVYRYMSVPKGSIIHFDLQPSPWASRDHPLFHATAIKVKGVKEEEDSFKGVISNDLIGYPLIGWNEPLKMPGPKS
ncbi:hypothetical protein J3R30DRAFT_3424760 [Lentinula aciculospora]|uniref:Uncharacterized protein n=1 Tax=Lentinula aciculospora TaxID=153920 RepID=A0A9W9AX30_9AGAR|nr:hypothetical protein J3R30DRAFT_3424760 [Lentinula aciculospora]